MIELGFGFLPLLLAATAAELLLTNLLLPFLPRRLQARLLAPGVAHLGFLIPAIAMAVGAGASWLKNRAANKAVEEQQQLYNQWLKAREAGVADLLDKVSAAGYDPYGPQTSTTQGTQTGEYGGTSRTATAQDVTPTLTPEYKQLESAWRGILENRLSSPTSSLPEGYLGAVTRGTNDAYRGAEVAAQNLAARRGLSGEQSLSIGEPIAVARAGKIADVANQLPLLGRSLQNEDVNLAANLAAQFGKGQSMRGTSATTTGGWTSGASSGSMTTPPNLSMLASLLLPPAPNAGTQTGISPAGGVAGDLASSLLSLWQAGAFTKKPGTGTPFDPDAGYAHG